MKPQTAEQLRMARIVRDHYRLNRPVTQAEVDAEISSIKRKRERGTLDDFSETLAARLRV